LTRTGPRVLIPPFLTGLLGSRRARQPVSFPRPRPAGQFAASFDAVLADAGIEVVKIPPPGSGAEAWIDTDDVGDVVAAVLLDERHTGYTYSLSGPRTLTMAQVADELATATGRSIRYVDLDPDEHVAELTGFGLPREDAQAQRDLFSVIRNHRSEYVSHGVEEVLGRAPRDFTDRARFTAQAGAWSAM